MPLIPGLTSKISRPWQLSDYRNWLSDYVNDGAVVVAHSNGGRLIIDYLAHNEQCLSALVLIDSAGLIDNNFILRFKRLIFKYLAKTGKSLIGTNPLARNLLYKLARESDYQSAPPHSAETMKNLISVDLTDQAKSIKLPTLLIWGQNDAQTPAWMGRKLNSLIPRSSLIVIKNARHSPQFTHTTQVVDNIDKFIKKHS